jgi:hypothetical protein
MYVVLIFEEKNDNSPLTKIVFHYQPLLKTSGRYGWVKAAVDILSFVYFFSLNKTYKGFKNPNKTYKVFKTL